MSNKKEVQLNLEQLISGDDTSWPDEHVESAKKTDSKAKPSKMGRPKVDPSDKLKSRFSLNLSDREFDKLKKHCDELGVTASQYARRMVLKSLND